MPIRPHDSMQELPIEASIRCHYLSVSAQRALHVGSRTTHCAAQRAGYRIPLASMGGATAKPRLISGLTSPLPQRHHNSSAFISRNTTGATSLISYLYGTDICTGYRSKGKDPRAGQLFLRSRSSLLVKERCHAHFGKWCVDSFVWAKIAYHV
ncbi:hypothetical protein EV356DRAFT_502439 [Viridothelium virens]|uniref:Uncharacterized protein n=1 Tax=Viridothelium virens TaxID=1048519 RepID=A0A6A6HML8_VIRVR|nr:hypothetical protein EV356DRAFT_502439 [Viridothelium virens]